MVARSWSSRVLVRGSLLLGLVLPCYMAPRVSEASGSSAPLVLVYEAGASTAPIGSVLALSGWLVEAHDTAAGLMRIQKQGPLASAATTVITLLEALQVVRAVEGQMDVALRGDYHGTTSQGVVFDDDLEALDIRPSDAFQVMATPLAVPVAPTYTPRVAVLDGGFSFGHQGLPLSAIAAQFDAIDNDAVATDTGNGIDDDADGVTDGGVGHGLGMAGAIHALCPHADLYCVRVLDDEGRGTNFQLASGLSWALGQGVDVISLSLGMSGYSAVVDMLLEDAANQGILVVAAAGNDAANGLVFPASSAHTLAVTGVDEDADADLAVNFHTDVYLSAPSRAVPGPHPAASDAFGWWSGSSVSCALVAGALALMTGENPGDPEACAVDLASDALGLGYVPTPRVGKHGAGIPDVGAITAP